MGAKHFFHPYHMIPGIKFISAFMEFSNHGIPHMGMKFHTVFCQVLIFFFRIGNAYIQINDILSTAQRFHGLIKLPANAALSIPLLHVNAQFCSPVIGSSSHERTGVGISQDFTAAPLFQGLRHNIGIFLQGALYASFHLLKTGNVIFKGDGGMFHIGGIDILYLFRVLFIGDPYPVSVFSFFHFL